MSYRHRKFLVQDEINAARKHRHTIAIYTQRKKYRIRNQKDTRLSYILGRNKQPWKRASLGAPCRICSEISEQTSTIGLREQKSIGYRMGHACIHSSIHLPKSIPTNSAFTTLSTFDSRFSLTTTATRHKDLLKYWWSLDSTVPKYSALTNRDLFHNNQPCQRDQRRTRKGWPFRIDIQSARWNMQETTVIII